MLLGTGTAANLSRLCKVQMLCCVTCPSRTPPYILPNYVQACRGELLLRQAEKGADTVLHHLPA